MSRAERAREAAELRAQGLLYREIAERMGISRSYAQDLVTDPDYSRLERIAEIERRHKASGPWPSISTVLKHFGGKWVKAIEAAGFEPRHRRSRVAA